jgi:hypothetical protein
MMLAGMMFGICPVPAEGAEAAASDWKGEAISAGDEGVGNGDVVARFGNIGAIWSGCVGVVPI